MSKKWNLVADVGGTNARFARYYAGDNGLHDFLNISVADHDNFTDALDHYLEHALTRDGWEAMPRATCFAVACPVDNEEITFTNSPWHFTRTEVKAHLDQHPLKLVNDFAAVGYAISALSPADWVQVGGEDPVPSKPVVVLGPGTGLGVSIVVPTNDSFVVVDGEGGHVDFAPVEMEELKILEVLMNRYSRVSEERLLSGKGLLNIYQALVELAGVESLWQKPEEVSEAALEGSDPLAVRSLEVFCRVMGSVSGNLALTAGALGGVYITGGIIPKMLDFFAASDFRKRFENKGRFGTYMKRIPVRVVIRKDLGLLGAAKKLTLSGH